MYFNKHILASFMIAALATACPPSAKPPDPSDTPSDDPSDDPSNDPSDDPTPTCTEGIPVNAAELRSASIETLRAFFNTEAGFDDGHLYFRDVANGMPDCPSYDQAAVIYAAPIADEMVPAEILSHPSMQQNRVIEVWWGLNGNRYIYFNTLEDNSTPGVNGYLPLSDLFPVSFSSIITRQLTPEETNTILEDIRAAAGPVPVDYLDAIGIITVSPRVDDRETVILTGDDRDYYAGTLSAAALIRELSDTLTAPEWSPIQYKFGIENEPGERIPDDAVTFYPECLRTLTRQLAEEGYIFASQPSMAPPFGPGWQDNPEVANCGARR